jgi:hypothetical protein
MFPRRFYTCQKIIKEIPPFLVYVGPCRVLDQIGKKFKGVKVFGNFYDIEDLDDWCFLPLEYVRCTLENMLKKFYRICTISYTK